MNCDMIEKIHIKGYKSIKEAEVDLGRINILIGGNGIGKTNFISVFTLMRNIYEQNLQSYVRNKRGASSLLYMGRKQTQNIELDLCFRHGDYLNRYIVNLKEADDDLSIESAQTAFFSNGWHYRVCDSNVDEATIKYRNDNQNWYVNPLLKQFEVFHFHDTGDTSPMKQACSLYDNSFLRRDGSNIAAFLYWMQQKFPKYFDRIERTIKSVSPFFDSFSLSPDRLNEETIRLEWKQKGAEDTYFNANQLSDGTLRFICLATLLMQPTPPKTIIIDEPELGLHPLAISKLAALIRKVSATSQVIISTQSVSLVDCFEAKDIIVVDMKDNASWFHRLNEMDLRDWLDNYTIGEIWEKNLIGGQPF